MKNIFNNFFLALTLLTFNTIAFAQKTMSGETPIQVAEPKDLNILVKLGPYIDWFLLLGVAIHAFIYFVDFKTDKAFLRMLPIALSVFIAFHWRTILGWIGVFGI